MSMVNNGKLKKIKFLCLFAFAFLLCSISLLGIPVVQEASASVSETEEFEEFYQSFMQMVQEYDVEEQTISTMSANGTVEEEPNYQTRLIVMSDSAVDDYGAVASCHYKNYYYFQYEDYETTDEAYDYYLGLDGVQVMYDYKTTINDDFTTGEYITIDSSSYNSWGWKTQNDYLGELSNREFIILTNSYKAERIASFLVYAFDTIVDKFYSEDDANQGYIILRGNDNAGKRIPLASTSIGIISNEHKVYTNVKTAINSLYTTYKLASTKPGSGYVMERPKISAPDAIKKQTYNNRILIIEPDYALNLLLKTTAELQGYETVSITDYDKTFETIKDYFPALIILDAGSDDVLTGLTIAKKLKKSHEYKNIKIILSTIVHDKKLILDTGADLYLPKPYELINIFNWAQKFIEEYNALTTLDFYFGDKLKNFVS